MPEGLEAFALVVRGEGPDGVAQHLTLGATWDEQFARAFARRVRGLPPFSVTVVSRPARPGGAVKVQGIPDEFRGPADAGRWLDADGEQVYHVQRGELGDQVRIRSETAHGESRARFVEPRGWNRSAR